VQPFHYARPLSECSLGVRLWLRLSYRVVGLFFRLVSRLSIVGGENIPRQDGVVLASNHISLLDTILIPYSVMTIHGVQFVWSPAKAELFGLPIIGRILDSWGAFPVRRGRSDLRAMRRIRTHMQTGKVMLFPEGTRNADGRLGKGKRTVGKLIYNARPVVVPLAVWGTNQVWPKGWRLFHWRPPIGVRYGQPLDLQPYYNLPDTKETAEAIVEEIMRAIARQLEPHEVSATPIARRIAGSGETSNGSPAV
jgi:1-acyl-sn-glycerol-3-phosphate acyltransferase